MQITAVEFPQIRRLEAISFRSFPATTTYFNGTWAVRLSAGLPAKRLNCVNPLDPDDAWNIKPRLQQEIRRYQNFGRPLIFRITPLASLQLISHLDELGWQSFDESVVMTIALEDLDLRGAPFIEPLADTGYWVDAVLKLEEKSTQLKPGKVEVIQAIRAITGLFLTKDTSAKPLCALRAVLDQEMVGLFSMITALSRQRQGAARALLMSVLGWAKNQGANLAWLQVETSNRAAVSLYQSVGFQPAYHYLYRQPKKSRDAK